MYYTAIKAITVINNLYNILRDISIRDKLQLTTTELLSYPKRNPFL